MILILLKIMLCGLGMFHAADIGWNFTEFKQNLTTSKITGLLCCLVVILTGAFI